MSVLHGRVACVELYVFLPTTLHASLAATLSMLDLLGSSKLIYLNPTNTRE